jgi:tetratricopeptide (TPR) repeat protein
VAETELIRQGAGNYARAHREAREAARLVTGAISGQTWDRVIDAVDTADQDLAKLDDARLELLAAHLDMVVRIGDRARQRRMLATEAAPAIRAAGRRYGTRNAIVHRMRAARTVAVRFIGVDDARGRRSADRVAKAVYRHGLDSDKAIQAELRDIDVLRGLLLPELAAANARALVDRLPDDARRARVAAEVSNTCFDLGEMDAALHCFQLNYDHQSAFLDEHQEQVTALVTRASLENLLGGLLLGTGAHSRAESVLRGALQQAEALHTRVLTRTDARFLAEITDGTLANLGDTMVALGRWPEAHDYYLRAYRMGRARVSRAYFNGAVYAARAWQQI